MAHPDGGAWLSISQASHRLIIKPDSGLIRGEQKRVAGSLPSRRCDKVVWGQHKPVDALDCYFIFYLFYEPLGNNGMLPPAVNRRSTTGKTVTLCLFIQAQGMGQSVGVLLTTSTYMSQAWDQKSTKPS